MKWLERNHYFEDGKNIENVSLIDRKKVILPSFLIKLGLMKNFGKGINKGGKKRILMHEEPFP